MSEPFRKTTGHAPAAPDTRPLPVLDSFDACNEESTTVAGLAHALAIISYTDPQPRMGLMVSVLAPMLAERADRLNRALDRLTTDPGGLAPAWQAAQGITATPTPILHLYSDWRALQTLLNTLSPGPEADAAYNALERLDGLILAAPVAGPLDFAVKLMAQTTNGETDPHPALFAAAAALIGGTGNGGFAL